MARSTVNGLHNCFGCGICAVRCAKNIISIKLNKDGFYEPYLSDISKCTQCGLCFDVCSFSHDGLAQGDSQPLRSWAAWSRDEDIRNKCSSGGVTFEIGRHLIKEGFHVIGCRYNPETQRADHYIAKTVDELMPSIGSKYIQSYTVDAFSQIEWRAHKYLVIGTPCQIDSFRRLIRTKGCEDRFLLLDFFCHCVPSMLVWRAYLRMLEPQTGNVVSASWRNKLKQGWHDSWLMRVTGEKGIILSRRSQGDLFYKMFLGDYASGVQCEKQCKFKYNHSSADIRVGDLWGMTYANNNDGVNALVAFTEKGVKTVNELENVHLEEHPFNVVAEGQMRVNIRNKETRPLFISLLKRNVNLDSPLLTLLFSCQRVINGIKRLV